MLKCPFYKTVMAWQSVQPNKVAWGLYSSYLYLQRWQLLCPPRSIQEALRDTLVAISPLLCFMEKLLLMTIWSSPWNSYFSSKSFRGIEWYWDLVLDPVLCSAHGAPWQIDNTSSCHGIELEQHRASSLLMSVIMHLHRGSMVHLS